jgi:hypothetical protein
MDGHNAVVIVKWWPFNWIVPYGAVIVDGIEMAGDDIHVLLSG